MSVKYTRKLQSSRFEFESRERAQQKKTAADFGCSSVMRYTQLRFRRTIWGDRKFGGNSNHRNWNAELYVSHEPAENHQRNRRNQPISSRDGYGGNTNLEIESRSDWIRPSPSQEMRSPKHENTSTRIRGAGAAAEVVGRIKRSAYQPSRGRSFQSPGVARRWPSPLECAGGGGGGGRRKGGGRGAAFFRWNGQGGASRLFGVWIFRCRPTAEWNGSDFLRWAETSWALLGFGFYNYLANWNFRLHNKCRLLWIGGCTVAELACKRWGQLNPMKIC
jgi:hypothetical protein